MEKHLKKIRRRIKARQAEGYEVNRQFKKINNLLQPISDEEKYGQDVHVSFQEAPFKGEHTTLVTAATMNRLFLSIVFFIIGGFILQTANSNFSTAKNFLQTALTEDLPLANLNELYNQNFGLPLTLPFNEQRQFINNNVNDMLPLSGEVQETFSENGQGIFIKPVENSTVRSVNHGVVVFAGKKKDTGKTVIIQHADKTKTIYGNLSTIDVHIYQAVSESEAIATFKHDENSKDVFFAIEKNRQLIDPELVIPVDKN